MQCNAHFTSVHSQLHHIHIHDLGHLTVQSSTTNNPRKPHAYSTWHTNPCDGITGHKDTFPVLHWHGKKNVARLNEWMNERSRSHPQGRLKTKLWLRRARNETNGHAYHIVQTKGWMVLCHTHTKKKDGCDYSNTSPLTSIRGTVGGDGVPRVSQGLLVLCISRGGGIQHKKGSKQILSFQ